jgi:hypothetical protein
MIKCPKCEKNITRLRSEDIEANGPGTLVLRSIVFMCPSCSVVLGAQMDPVLLKTELKNELFAMLRH